MSDKRRHSRLFTVTYHVIGGGALLLFFGFLISGFLYDDLNPLFAFVLAILGVLITAGVFERARRRGTPKAGNG